MEAQKSKSEKQSSPAATTPPIPSCRKKKNEEGTFLEDLKDHIDEFVHASMDEHQSCFKKTIQKVTSVFQLCALLSLPQIYLFFTYLFLLVANYVIQIHSRCSECQRLLQKGVLKLRESKALFPSEQ